MESRQRTMLQGRLAEAEKKQKRYRIELAGAASNIILHFDPLDNDLEYVAQIDPERLQVYVDQIARVKPLFDKVSGEIQRLKSELGEED